METGSPGTLTMNPSVISEYTPSVPCSSRLTLHFSFSRSEIVEEDDNGDDDSDPDPLEVHQDDYAEAAYDAIQEEVKGGIYVINAKVVATERRIDYMVKRMHTLGETIRSNAGSILAMEGNQIVMMKDMAQIMSTMKDLASKGSRGNGRGRTRRYQGKRTAEKAEKRAEEGESGWVDE